METTPMIESSNPCEFLSESCRPKHPAVVTWLDMQRLSARIERALTASLREVGLSHSQFAMLLTIGSSEGLTQQDLAARIGLTKANVSQLLDRLEAAGMVQRVPESRAYALHLTEASRQLLANKIPEHQALIADQFSDLTGEEQAVLRGLVGRLVQSGVGVS
jgi:DNA-binding MarR family transcriptional regulator